MKRMIKESVLILITILGINNIAIGQAKYYYVKNQTPNAINMNNSSNPTIDGLPVNNWCTDGYSGPEEEWPESVNDELKCSYVGQTPRYAKQVVNDKDGNILFFIIDNYIYNKYGRGFGITTKDGLIFDEYVLKEDYNPYWDPTDFNFHIYQNIIVVPVPNTCDQFHIFYAMTANDIGGGNYFPKLYHRKLTFIDDLTISMTSEERIYLPLFEEQNGCDDCTTFGMSITPYNPITNDYLLLLHWKSSWATLAILSVTDIVSSEKYIEVPLSLSGSGQTPQCVLNKRQDIIVTEDNNGNPIYIFNHALEGGSNNTYLYTYRFPRDFQSISQSSSTNELVEYSTNNIIQGMEFSPSKHYMYVTFTDLSGIYYFDTYDFIFNNSSFPINYTALVTIGNYSHSFIEQFNDGKLYLVAEDPITGATHISSIDDPNNPTTTSITSNCFSGIQVKPQYLVRGYSCDYTDVATGITYYEYNKRYIFNHQIDDSDYTTNYPSVYCVQPDWNTIGSTETWSPGAENNPFRSETGVVYLDDDFEIPSGKYIQLNDMEFHFAESKKAIVNTGSTLRLVGSTLTSADMCGETVMWGGVYLVGNPALDQSTSNQGRLRMDSGSEISNATNGVYVEGGGICEIYAGTFKNNYISINMAQYTHPTLPGYNASFIQMADFINDDILNNNGYPSKAIYLNAVKGIDITYSSFVNTMSNTIRANYRGMCIRSASSDFVLDDCEINGYYYGVYTTGGTPEIRNNTFANNYRGIYTGTSINVDVSNNLFDGDYSFLPPPRELFPNPTPFITSQYNVYIAGDGVNNTVYKFEENSITNGTIGSLFYSTGPNAVQAKDNSYSNITGSTNACAAVAIGKNSNFVDGSIPNYGQIGLEFRCNSFATSPYALSIIDGNMRKYQGENGATSGSDYAGNAFDHYGTNAERDFYVDLDIVSSLDIQQYEYYSHADGDHTLLEDNELIIGIPSSYTQSKVAEYEYSNDFVSSDCEEGTGGGGGIIRTKSTADDEGQTLSVCEEISLIENTDTEILLLEAELEETTDAGNTFILLSEVETMSDNNSIEVAQEIAGLNGYISDEVAITYMQNNSGNEFAKANALLENSPLPANARNEIENMEMNPGLKHIINQNQQGTNARDKKQAEIAKLKQFRGLVVNEMYMTAIKDTSLSERQELKQFLQNEEKLQSKFHLYNLNRFENDRNSAIATLETIRQYAQDMDIEYAGKIEDYIDLQLIMIDIESGIMSYEDAVENNTDLLNMIATDESSFGYVTANQLLAEAGINEYYETIKLPEPEMEDRSTLNKSGTEQLTEVYDDIINIYPNPASDVIYIEYAFFDNDTDRLIEIYGINGNLIDKINLSHAVGVFTYNKKLPAGNYIIKLGNNYSQKITVQ